MPANFLWPQAMMHTFKGSSSGKLLTVILEMSLKIIPLFPCCSFSTKGDYVTVRRMPI